MESGALVRSKSTGQMVGPGMLRTKSTGSMRPPLQRNHRTGEGKESKESKAEQKSASEAKQQRVLEAKLSESKRELSANAGAADLGSRGSNISGSSGSGGSSGGGGGGGGSSGGKSGRPPARASRRPDSAKQPGTSAARRAVEAARQGVSGGETAALARVASPSGAAGSSGGGSSSGSGGGEADNSPRSRIRTKMALTLNFANLNLNGVGTNGDLVAVSPLATGGRDSGRSRASRGGGRHGPDSDDESDSSFCTPRDDTGGRWNVGRAGIVEMPQSALDAIHSVVRPISAVDKSTASTASSKADDFIRLRMLGGGAGGRVWLAIHKKHLQLVALKIIDYTNAETQEQRRVEIERELTILHPNFVPLGQPDLKPQDYCNELVSFHGAFTTERFITIIMEFMCVRMLRCTTHGAILWQRLGVGS
jgi:hypothetical protein